MDVVFVRLMCVVSQGFRKNWDQILGAIIARNEYLSFQKKHSELSKLKRIADFHILIFMFFKFRELFEQEI